MKRIAFVLKLAGSERESGLSAVKTLKEDFDDACSASEVRNFSMWHMEEYIFGYGENESEDMACFDGVFEKLPDDVRLVCAPGSMRLMYHDLGIVREDKSLIRHRVFATRIKEGCEEEYKRRHDGLIEKRGDTIKEGPESDFTIWYGDGCIFGYCELVRAFDEIEPSEEDKAFIVAWETRQLEIMDWITDDVDWLTGQKHPAVERVL